MVFSFPKQTFWPADRRISGMNKILNNRYPTEREEQATEKQATEEQATEELPNVKPIVRGSGIILKKYPNF